MAYPYSCCGLLIVHLELSHVTCYSWWADKIEAFCVSAVFLRRPYSGCCYLCSLGHGMRKGGRTTPAAHECAKEIEILIYATVILCDVAYIVCKGEERKETRANKWATGPHARPSQAQKCSYPAYLLRTYASISRFQHAPWWHCGYRWNNHNVGAPMSSGLWASSQGKCLVCNTNFLLVWLFALVHFIIS